MIIIWIFNVKMTCFGASRVALFRSKCKILVRLEAPTSYRTYDTYMQTYRLRHVLWIRRIVSATQVVQPLFYRTYDLLSWIAIQVRWLNA